MKYLEQHLAGFERANLIDVALLDTLPNRKWTGFATCCGYVMYLR